MTQVAPYRALAQCYDAVMDHVDYEVWVELIETLLEFHDHAPGDVIELVCGTATFSCLFAARNKANYLATDASREMLCVAREKARDSDIEFAQLRFESFDDQEIFDTVFLLFDGLNYITDEADVLMLFRRVYRALRSGGLFIFDQSTPANSLNNLEYFRDAGRSGLVSFIRHSEYDEETAVHTTRFEITTSDNVFEEIHFQKCYTGSQIQEILEKTEFEIEAGYDGFSLETADTESERIHWVVRKH